ncbi:hypothetical protein ACFLZ5_00965 [Thermodesulfobacteriota bacterium]
MKFIEEASSKYFDEKDISKNRPVFWCTRKKQIFITLSPRNRSVEYTIDNGQIAVHVKVSGMLESGGVAAIVKNNA